ncbi:hypothetical protein C2G38_2032006 [Gigaspora rosea]|uniref:Uncharacterized protein n=1 Tax=Gigaspora rosea TaxID=44941 RepID=A0A397VTH1_9GLOM|nr:hypothetical protein C2G38_2032006 [Gigaspora rosea]
MSDADAIEFAKENGIDVNKIFYMSKRERLISEEIYLRNFEDAKNLGHMFMIIKSSKKVLAYFKRMVLMVKSLKLQVIITGIIWEEEEVKAWRNDILIKFLHYPNLAFSKHRPGALYDAFIKVNVLGPEHMLALAQTFY